MMKNGSTMNQFKMPSKKVVDKIVRQFREIYPERSYEEAYSKVMEIARYDALLRSK